jgi:endonuclease-8
MPEIVEVKKYAQLIKKYLVDTNITEINILDGRYKNKGPFDLYKEIKKMLPIKIIDVKTKGKLIYFILENNFFILNTLGLTGGWCFQKKNENNYIFPKLSYENDNYKDKSTDHINVEFKNKLGSLFFFDTLSFGTIKIIDNDLELNKKLKSLGPDFMDNSTDFNVFKENILKKKNLKKSIGNVIVDQKTISGLGNYLRSDILWLCNISPIKHVDKLTDQELNLIYKNAKFLVWSEYNYNKGIKLGYIKKTDKLPKNYDRNFFVYMQEYDIYGNKVETLELFEGSQKRFIHWVPKLQK